MTLNEAFIGQVQLLVATLPQVYKEDCFALKGGTAINLFIRDMPRLSVDIPTSHIFRSKTERPVSKELAQQ